MISGTPTAVAAQANYTVTAAYGTSSTSATIQITLTHRLWSIGRRRSRLWWEWQSRRMRPRWPEPSRVSVSPALPAGLSLNPSTGIVSGTPTAVTTQANYTVSATDSLGNTSAILTITVLQAPLLELGHGYGIGEIRFVGIACSAERRHLRALGTLELHYRRDCCQWRWRRRNRNGWPDSRCRHSRCPRSNWGV